MRELHDQTKYFNAFLPITPQSNVFRAVNRFVPFKIDKIRYHSYAEFI